MGVRGSKNQSPYKRGETDKLDRFLCAEELWNICLRSRPIYLNVVRALVSTQVLWQLALIASNSNVLTLTY